MGLLVDVEAKPVAGAMPEKLAISRRFTGQIKRDAPSGATSYPGGI